MTIILAQADIGALRADFIKSMVIFGVVLTVVICAIAGVVIAWMNYRLEKKSRKEPVKNEISPQPLEVTKTKRLNYGEVKIQFDDHERRILALEESSSELMAKLESDKEEILKSGSDRELRLQQEIANLPSKIVTDILNTRKLFQQ